MGTHPRQDVLMTRAISLRSRVPGNWQARFWRPAERGDPSAEFNGETHRGQQLPPALTLPQVRSGLSQLLLEVYYTPGVDEICRQVQRQLMRNELARFYHHRTRKCMPPRKLRRDIQ
ncbi:MAG TPA: hypothetical protein VK667_12190 [Ktedonobacteraceae bacterium]|nr:hypothetical protein [Ktedonobacteraceae bacterium]